LLNSPKPEDVFLGGFQIDFDCPSDVLQQFLCCSSKCLQQQEDLKSKIVQLSISSFHCLQVTSPLNESILLQFHCPELLSENGTKIGHQSSFLILLQSIQHLRNRDHIKCVGTLSFISDSNKFVLYVPIYLSPSCLKESIELAGSSKTRNLSLWTSNLLNILYPIQPVSAQISDEILLFQTLKPEEHVFTDSPALQPDGLTAILLPFQRRAVAWMMKMEHADSMKRELEKQMDTIPLLWQRLNVDKNQNDLFINRTTGAICTNSKELVNYNNEREVLGGILAEEMGLGKTLEILSLILLNPAPTSFKDGSQLDPHLKLTSDFSKKPLVPLAATLIISPPSILHQWSHEITLHAPNITHFIYEGTSTHPELKIEDFQHVDIVLTSYEVLRKELPHAQGQHGRSRRFKRAYEWLGSRLVEGLWWRGSVLIGNFFKIICVYIRTCYTNFLN